VVREGGSQNSGGYYTKKRIPTNTASKAKTHHLMKRGILPSPKTVTDQWGISLSLSFEMAKYLVFLAISLALSVQYTYGTPTQNPPTTTTSDVGFTPAAVASVDKDGVSPLSPMRREGVHSWSIHRPRIPSRFLDIRGSGLYTMTDENTRMTRESTVLDIIDGALAVVNHDDEILEDVAGRRVRDGVPTTDSYSKQITKQ
jgi:hypothetical protein